MTTATYSPCGSNKLLMQIHFSVRNPPVPSEDWHERWEGADQGLICSWLRGIEKGLEDPVLAAKACAGELPVLAWKGGVEKPIKRTDKMGSLKYLATWQGLRGEDLNIDLSAEVQMVCTRTGVPVLFTGQLKKLLEAEPNEELE